MSTSSSLYPVQDSSSPRRLGRQGRLGFPEISLVKELGSGGWRRGTKGRGGSLISRRSQCPSLTGLCSIPPSLLSSLLPEMKLPPIAYRKLVSRTIFDFILTDLRIIRISKKSVSSLTKFNSAQDNDNYWLGRLDHKDWLSPNEIFKIIKNVRDPELIIGAFKKASARMDYKPSEALYSLLIDKLAYAHKFDAIDGLLERAGCERCRLSDGFFYTVIKIYGNVANHPELAIKTLFRMPDFHCWPTIKTFNYVLNMLVCTKRFEAIHEVYLSAPRLGVTFDTCCFNILINGLCRWEKLDAAFSLLHEIPKQGCRPNATTYSTLMYFLCKNGKVSEAFELCDRMEREGCHPDTITFNILISGCCKQGRVAEGMELLKKMKLKGCYPNSGTNQALLYGLLGSNMYVEAKNFINMMISEGSYPSFLSYKLAIHGLCCENLLNDVDLVLKQMVHQGFVPRMGTWMKIVKCMSLKMNNLDHAFVY